MSPRHALSKLAPLVFVAGAAMGQHDPAHHPPTDPHAEHRQAPPAPSSEHDAHAAHRAADEQTESERAHVPPDPPSLVLGNLSTERMIELMQMEDDAPLGMLRLDELEAFSGDHDGLAWEAHAWYGTDYHKLWLKTEGERIESETAGRAELLWDRIVSAWWSVQIGARHDSRAGPSRTWAAVGVQGLAPQFIEIEATFYLGDEGRTAARLSAERDVLITQRLVLQPQFELEAHGKDDLANGIGAGLSDVELGLRLRYELIREVAPYVGVQWERKLGDTADFVRAAGGEASDVLFVAGLRAWF